MTSVKPAEKLVSCGDLSCEFLVDPIPRPRPESLNIKVRPDLQRVVFVDSRKPNSTVILRRSQAILRAHGIDVRIEPKENSAGLPMPGEQLDRLVEEGALVLSAIND